MRNALNYIICSWRFCTWVCVQESVILDFLFIIWIIHLLPYISFYFLRHCLGITIWFFFLFYIHPSPLSVCYAWLFVYVIKSNFLLFNETTISFPDLFYLSVFPIIIWGSSFHLAISSFSVCGLQLGHWDKVRKWCYYCYTMYTCFIQCINMYIYWYILFRCDWQERFVIQ